MTDTNHTTTNDDNGKNKSNNNSFPFWKLPVVGTGLLQKFAATPILTPTPIRTRESLPAPPTGMEWILSGSSDSEKKEWRLIKATSSVITTPTSATNSPSEPELINEQEDTKPKTTQVTAAPVSPCKPSTTMATTTMTSGVHNIIDQSSLLSLLKPPLLPGSFLRPPNNQIRNTSIASSDDNEQQQQQHQQVEDAWELLSDRISTSSNQTPTVILHNNNYTIKTPSSGSVRSLSSMEKSLLQDNNNTILNHNIPFKIQRTTSSSTIDSSEQQNATYIGPLGKGILGVDYVEHVILPTDTLQGICIAYKITSTQLRLANNFSGNSLLLAPSKLVIPLSKQALRSGYIRVQDTDQKEYKIHALLAEFPDFSMTEAKAYLELADWVLKDAIRSAKDDHEWEVDNDEEEHRNITYTTTTTTNRDTNHNTMMIRRNRQCTIFKSGEIRITPKLNETGIPIGFHTKGAGIIQQQQQQQQLNHNNKDSAILLEDKVLAQTVDSKALATTTMNQKQPQEDIYAQHNSFGVELQSLPKKSSTS